MSGCDLSSLNATSFERLVRALAFTLFGASGTVFSTGPDVGRDFIIEGNISGYEAKDWDGYLVLQAKFREKPQRESLSGRLNDVDWLKAQIDGEKEKDTDATANLRPPKYYILATNVSLSGADRAQEKARKE